MACTRRWAVESKFFELVVVGDETGVRLRENCKGKLRSILLDRDEIEWLVRIFEELVDVEDSQVFWDQGRPGFPRVIVQRCFNRHESFLLVEEYDGRKKSRVVLVPEGRRGEGWDIFGSALRWVNEFFIKGATMGKARPVVQAARGSRTFAEVLKKNSVPIHTLAPAPVPAVRREKKMKNSYPTVKSSTTSHGPSVFAQKGCTMVGRVSNGKDAHCHKQTIKGRVDTDTLPHFGESIVISNLKETLLKLKEDVDQCLKRLGSAEIGLIGWEQAKPHKPISGGKLQVGQDVSKPKWMKKADTKGKAVVIENPVDGGSALLLDGSETGKMDDLEASTSFGPSVSSLSASGPEGNRSATILPSGG
jgi:hypothetical protein